MQLKIEKLVYGGDGLARLPADEKGRGKTVFTPFVLPGEEIEAALVESRPGFARAKIERLLTPSPERVDPGCPYFGHCGGCHYQHIDYAAQLRYKAEILRETLRRTAKFELQQEIQVHSAQPWGYRNRTRMHVRHQPGFTLGYFQHSSHDLLAVESCPISSPLLNQAIAAVWTLGREGTAPESLHGLQFFTNHDDTRLLVEAYVRPGIDTKDCQPFAAALQRVLREIAGVVVFATSPVEDESRQRAPLSSIHGEASEVTGESSLVYHAAGIDYRVSGGSFFQTNRYLVDKLVEIVTANRSGRKALDLYAGAGLFAKQLARNFEQVQAVEASPYSYADLQHDAPANLKCVRNTTEAFLTEREAKRGLDLIVLDPPRAGLGEKSAKALERMSASHVTYVSCDPATLSRDLKVLLESGYRVEQTHLVDMFPQTYHMETVLHLAR